MRVCAVCLYFHKIVQMLHAPFALLSLLSAFSLHRYLSLFLHSLSLPLAVGLLKFSYEVWGERCELRQWRLGRRPSCRHRIWCIKHTTLKYAIW